MKRLDNGRREANRVSLSFSLGKKFARSNCSLSLTVLIDQPSKTHANDAPEIAAGLSPAAAVRIKVDVAERIGKAEIAAVGVNHVDEGRVGPGQMSLLPGVHVQRISRIQSGDSADLREKIVRVSRGSPTIDIAPRD